jgi:hypothetical protein
MTAKETERLQDQLNELYKPAKVQSGPNGAPRQYP